MKQPIDLIGQRFGRLTVVDVVFDERRRCHCRCICECGKRAEVYLSDLMKGRQVSCGCFRRDITSSLNKTHGKHNSRLSRIWRTMKSRCNNPNVKVYPRYGGRGIQVCREWNDSFLKFYEWALASGYADDLTIDRIDNNGNYCPENCRWVTVKEQNNNRSSCHFLTAFGKTQTISQWSREVDIGAGRISYRILHGWTPERALTTPPKGSVPKSDTNN